MKASYGLDRSYPLISSALLRSIPASPLASGGGAARRPLDTLLHWLPVQAVILMQQVPARELMCPAPGRYQSALCLD